MIELLYAGRGAAAGRTCNAIRKIGEDLRKLLLVPAIQATLSASLKLSHTDHTEEDVAEAYVFSRALLPLLEEADSSAAKSIEGMLTLGGGKSFNRATGSSMFALFAKTYDKLGVDCDLIGETKEFSACENPSQTTETYSKTLLLGIGIAMLFVAIILVLVMFYWNKKRTDCIKMTQYSNYSFNTECDDPTEGLIQKSFRRRRAATSPKANSVLSLITSYGDDETEREADEVVNLKDDAQTGEII
jgi:hypothetical protein